MRTSLVLISLLALASCAQKYKTIPQAKQQNHVWQCMSVQLHDQGGKEVKSVLGYNYSSLEFRSRKSRDGSAVLTYTVNYPGGRNETSSFTSGMRRLEPVINGKQWVSDEWHRVSLRSNGKTAEALGVLTKTRTLRQLEKGGYRELEVQKTINGEATTDVQELWARSRKEITARKYEETRTLLNPAQVEPGLKSWIITCTDEWENP